MRADQRQLSTGAAVWLPSREPNSPVRKGGKLLADQGRAEGTTSSARGTIHGRCSACPSASTI